MNRIILTVCCSFFFCCLLPTSEAQTTSLDSADVFRQLLAMPAPTPRTEDLKAEKVHAARPTQFLDKDKAPPDDAPMDDLLEYWNAWVDNTARPNPSERVKQRFLDAGLADP